MLAFAVDAGEFDGEEGAALVVGGFVDVRDAAGDGCALGEGDEAVDDDVGGDDSGEGVALLGGGGVERLVMRTGMESPEAMVTVLKAGGGGGGGGAGGVGRYCSWRGWALDWGAAGGGGFRIGISRVGWGGGFLGGVGGFAGMGFGAGFGVGAGGGGLEGVGPVGRWWLVGGRRLGC